MLLPRNWKLVVWYTYNTTAMCNSTTCADFPNSVAKRHILGVRTQGGYDPKFELGRDLCTMHLPPNFIILLYV